MTNRNISIVIAVALLLSVSSLWAQAHSPSADNATWPVLQQRLGESQSQTPPAIRATTRLVQVSVVVHDKHGNPIPDLTKDDFVVLDEKKLQEIRLFSVETNQVPTQPPPALPPDTYTNRIERRSNVPTSVTVILFDGLNTRITDQAYAKRQVVKFIRSQVRPQDRVAIYSLGRDLVILHDFTSDAQSLLAALEGYRGRNTPELEASEARQEYTPGRGPAIQEFLNNAYQREANYFVTDRVRRTAEAMTAIANHLGTLPGRKNLIWVSGSFPFSIGYENFAKTATDEKEIYGKEIETAARALTNANLAIYPVDARGLITFDLQPGATPSILGAADEPDENSSYGRVFAGTLDPRMKGPDTATFDTMNMLADRTGGRAFYNRNDLWNAVRNAIDDSRVTYELGYYPQGIKWNGKFREIKVEVKRAGAHVRARKGYFALPEPKLTPQLRQAVIALSAKSPLEPTGIGVTVRLQKADSEGRTLRTVASLDLHDFAMEFKDGLWYGTLDTVILQMDNHGEIIDALDQTFQLHLDADTYQKYLKEGITNTKDIPVRPQAIELRVMLRDGVSGTIGGVNVSLAKYFPASSAGLN